jgi:hypothetical protein
MATKDGLTNGKWFNSPFLSRSQIGLFLWDNMKKGSALNKMTDKCVEDSFTNEEKSMVLNLLEFLVRSVKEELPANSNIVIEPTKKEERKSNTKLLKELNILLKDILKHSVAFYDLAERYENDAVAQNIIKRIEGQIKTLEKNL